VECASRFLGLLGPRRLLYLLGESAVGGGEGDGPSHHVLSRKTLPFHFQHPPPMKHARIIADPRKSRPKAPLH
jgi:hypothetical protein